ncbi:hypothetical protein GINT2_001920 [Glugoides intestinalis]
MLKKYDIYRVLSNINPFKISIEKLTKVSIAKPGITTGDCQQAQIVYNVFPKDVVVMEYNMNIINIIGHRGMGEKRYSNSYNNEKYKGLRENTIESFLLAEENQAQMVEMDIHLTKDDFLVIYHDFEVDKMLISEMSYDDFILKTKSRICDFKKTNTTLENILETLPDSLALYLEVKYNDNIIYPNNYASRMITSLIDLVEKYPKKKIMFASFSPTICLLLKTYCPKYKTSFLVNGESLSYVKEFEANDVILKIFETVNLDGIVCCSGIIDKIRDSLQVLKEKGVVLMCYGPSANNIESVNRLKEIGFTGFCTDNLEIHKLKP